MLSQGITRQKNTDNALREIKHNLPTPETESNSEVMATKKNAIGLAKCPGSLEDVEVYPVSIQLVRREYVGAKWILEEESEQKSETDRLNTDAASAGREEL